MADKGFGRSRGRGRGHERPKPTSTSFSAPTSKPWNRRPGPSSQSEAEFSQRVGRSSQHVSHGDSAARYPGERQHEKMDISSSYGEGSGSGYSSSGSAAAGGTGGPGGSGGGGGDIVSTGRGAMRGRRVLAAEILNTKPEHIQSKSGIKGRPVMLQANYFKLLTTTDWVIYQYRVDFSPEEDRTVVRKGLLKLHKETLGAYIFDGTVLYTSNRLNDPLELFSTRQSDNAQIRINIKLVGDMVKGDYHYLQFFNIIMRKCLGCLNLQMVGRNYYEARAKVEVHQYGLEIWPGYLTTIRQHERDILMCSEIIHKIMRQDTMLDALNSCYQEDRSNYRDIFQRKISGSVVLTSYNNNTYRIDGVDFNVTPESTFRLRNGEAISYMDYYNNKYQIKIRSRNQPMLICKSRPKDRRAGQSEVVYLVPELCQMTGLSDEMRANFSLMKSVAEHTRVNPQARINALMAFNRRFRTESRIFTELKEWNLTLDDKLMDVPGRVLDPERIVIGGGRVMPVGPQGDWTNQLRQVHMYRSGELKNWVIVYLNRMERDVTYFLTQLNRAASGLHFAIREPRVHVLRDDRSSTYTEKLEEIMSKSNPELIFCVVSNNRADRYIAIKRKCCIDRPVPTQVFLAKNLAHQTRTLSIATKVAIQISCKLGGAPWACEIPTGDLMVIGFDVCHSKTGTSFGALVASLDKCLTRYYSSVSMHTGDEELSNEISVHTCKALRKYRELNGMFPKRIVMYRDGVGEGQVPYVFEHEVQHLHRQLCGLYGDPAAVKLAYIIVTKRLNTRLFHNRGNPEPGTVVDDIITNAIKYDFFIVSQSVRQGTVSPTNYNVIFDTSGWSPDILQRLSYKLTHLYYNCTTTVRVPAPCQYAHKLAFLVTECIRQPPSTQMDTLLYFL